MAYNFKKITVLIVENSTAMFDLTYGVLKQFGITDIHSAFDVESGFNKFQDVQPDLVLIDWLDEKDGGLRLTKKIRNPDSSHNPFAPIIMMTGYSQKRRVLMARDSGITEFLVKPYTAKTLYDKIEAIIERPRNFVKANGFFGPDRRRKKVNYMGQDRRQGKSKPRTPAQIAKERRERAKSEGNA